MAQLRAYYLNGGEMLRLVRYQKQEFPKAVGDEYRSCLSSYDIIKREKSPRNEAKKHEERKYEETMSHTIKLNTKKRVRFEKWLWELI